MIRRFTVTGRSMEPSYRDGDVVLATQWKKPRVGDVVIVPDPRMQERLLVKRIVEENGETVHLAGDNALESTDSRDFGAIAKQNIMSVVLYP